MATMIVLSAISASVLAEEMSGAASEATIAAQNAILSNSTNGKGYGPQSPRDLNSKIGSNKRLFNSAPAYQNLNLCNIHMHKNAEHSGGEFTQFAGYGSGYKYVGKLSASESQPLAQQVCKNEHGSLSERLPCSFLQTC